MAKHTDRYDKNIIELAKKEYQSTQRGKLPVELVRLASGGDIYPALDRVVDLSKLKPIPFELSADKNGEFEYEVSDTTKIKFKFASSDILESIDEAELISGLLTKTITQVNDSRKSADIEKFIRYEFLAIDARKFRNYIAEKSPKINYEYEFEGEAGGTFLATFQVGSDFFWS